MDTPGGTSSCSGIFIKGGVVVATGGANSPGVGIGNNNRAGDTLFEQGSKSGAVSISNCVEKLTAIKGEGAPYSVGISKCYTKGALIDLVFVRSLWFNGKSFLSEEVEKRLMESPFVYPFE